MVKLPINVDIHNLIDDLRIFSWEAADILIYYSSMLKNSDFKKKIIKNTNLDDPVTLADLKVNEIIIERIKKNYKAINWEICRENVKNNLTILIEMQRYILSLMEQKILFMTGISLLYQQFILGLF